MEYDPTHQCFVYLAVWPGYEADRAELGPRAADHLAQQAGGTSTWPA